MRVDGRIRFEYATCGRGNFGIRKEKVADSKISGYVWTGLKSSEKPFSRRSSYCVYTRSEHVYCYLELNMVR